MNRTRIVVALVALLLVALAGPSRASSPADYITYLTHSGGAMEGFPDPETATGAAIEAWADDEAEWLMSNPPAECFALEWGSWLRVVTVIKAWGYLRSAGVDAYIELTYMDEVVLAAMAAHREIMEASDPTDCM